MRLVISSFDWVNSEWTEATQTSNPCRNSGPQSTSPLGSMFSSVPWRSTIFPAFPSLRTCSRCFSIFSSVMRCMYRFGA